MKPEHFCRPWTLMHNLVVLCFTVALFACGGSGNSTSGDNNTPLTPPVISSGPADTSVPESATARFSVTATGSAPITYQWQVSVDDGLSWSDAPVPSTEPTYTRTSTNTAENGHRYRVQVTNAAGSVTSGTARLTVTVGAPPSVERQIMATTTDARISAAPAGTEAPHVAINPSPDTTAKGRLLVFLPGTRGQPLQYTYLLRAAAVRGFHAVGINYPNQTAMGTLCQNSTDADCYWKARRVVIFGGGTPVAGQSAVTEADAIVNRLDALLAYLDRELAPEQWGQFLQQDGTVDWSKVVMAGHSQGGGHVGILAKTVALARAVYFSSPEDWNESNDTPASWTSRPNVTPANQQYGFGADADTLVPNAHAFTHWDAIGMYAPLSGPVSVDAGGPFSGVHQLHTASSYNPSSTAVTLALKRHGITVVNTSTPTDGNGKPLFDSNGVWEYLCCQ